MVVPKTSGSVRIRVDYRPLNEHVLQEVHTLPKVDKTLAQLNWWLFWLKVLGISEALNADLQQIETWTEANRLRMNISKTQLMTHSGRLNKSDINVSLNGTAIPKSDSVNYFGVTIDQDLNWKSHVTSIRRRAFTALASIRKASSYLPVNTRKMLYLSLVLPHLDYCFTVWHSSCSQALSNSIEWVQNYAMRVILHQPPQIPNAPLRHKLGWSTLWQRRHRHMCQVQNCVLQIVPPPYLAAHLQRTQPFTHQHVEPTRSISSFPILTNLRCHLSSRR